MPRLCASATTARGAGSKRSWHHAIRSKDPEHSGQERRPVLGRQARSGAKSIWSRHGHSSSREYSKKNQTRAGAEGPVPFHGYFFKILTKQGRHAPGGKYDYNIKGHLVAGFALLAYPAQWQATGVNSFIINQADKVHEKNLGCHTIKLAQRMQEYDPDGSWQPAE